MEDRGPVGAAGRRLYQLWIDQGDDEGTSIEIPEDDLDLAPDPTTAERARANGLSTQGWPRQGFHVRYRRPKNKNEWTASLVPVVFLAVPPMERSAGGSVYAGGPDDDLVRVDLEFDPRLQDPRATNAIWSDLSEKARTIADAVFKSRHPTAKVASDAGVD